MSKRRVGGSGWAGVYGSFIGLSRSTAKGAGARLRSGNKAKPNKAGSLVATEVDLALKSTDDQVLQAAKRVRAVQADIDSTTARLALLKSQLQTVSAALAEEVTRASGTATISVRNRSPRRKGK